MSLIYSECLIYGIRLQKGTERGVPGEMGQWAAGGDAAQDSFWPCLLGSA